MSTAPAIILVAFNRPRSLKRLISSIENADYSGYSDISLVISIDGGGPQEVYKIAKDFEWDHGEKIVKHHTNNMGLRSHIISCGDFTNLYSSVIILEDDCFVSRNFYRFATQALHYYNDEKKIAGISLYSNRYNEQASLPFYPFDDGNDVFFMQIPSSWGQAWTKHQWEQFKIFYNNSPQITYEDKIPESVKKWPEQSWKKYFYKYLATENLFFVYPKVSHSTNFSDMGEHWKETFSFFQVPLELNNNPTYHFININESLNVYDGYSELFPDKLLSLGAEIHENTCIDVYGTKQIDLFNNEFCLSIKSCEKPQKVFSCELFPLINNVIFNLSGNTIFYSKKKFFKSSIEKIISNRLTKTQMTAGYYLASKTKYYKLGFLFLHPLLFFKKTLNRIRLLLLRLLK
jgi:hypothetical protein